MLVVVFLHQGCKDDEGVSSRGDVRTYKVAVIGEDDEETRWKRTGEMACRNIAEAQRGMEKQVWIEIEWKSQDDADIKDYLKRIAEDTTYVAIVGPTTSDMAERAVMAMDKSKKLVISPCATRVEYQRKVADEENVWNLSQSDLAQIEIMLYEATSYGYTDVVVLTSESSITGESESYIDWFAYMATEIGVNIGGFLVYKTDDELRSHVRSVCSTDDDEYSQRMLLFNPSGERDVEVFDEALYEEKEAADDDLYYPVVMCTDAFTGSKSVERLRNDDYEGLMLYADPRSGFAQAYKKYYGEDLSDGESQYYDALLMVSYALTYREVHGGDINGAMAAIVDGRDGRGDGWLPWEIGKNYKRLREGLTPDLSGASGNWTFTGKNHSSIDCSYYRHWKKGGDRLETMKYTSVTGDERTFSVKDIFDTFSVMVEALGDSTLVVQYPEKKGQWAVLVDGSKSYGDYRFHADVMSMYQMLRRHGYDDDHIIMIAEDNYASNENNKDQGVIRTSPNGENVYSREAIDYQLSELTPAEFGKIMAGEKTEKLTKVLETTENDNVFLFWSGHGRIGSLSWGEAAISYSDMKKYLSRTRHRKMLVATESCYSGGLGETSEGIPGVLFIAAAAPYETSRALVWNKDLQVFMTNGFTQGFMQALGQKYDVNLRDLYYKLAETTTGSHVKVYNEGTFGSVYRNDMGEWIGKEQLAISN